MVSLRSPHLMVEAGADPMARDVTVTDVLRYSKGVEEKDEEYGT